MVITMIDTQYKIKPKKFDIFPFINSVIMILFVIITLYPVLNTLAISLNDGTDALRGGIYLWPRKFTWKNYTTVLHKDNLITGAYITVARTLIGTLLSLAANAILAFIVSRKRFLFQREVSLFWVITMYVNGGLIPTFLLYKGLGLTNSFWVYVIPGMVSAFNMLVIRTYMNGIPDSLEESAQLDGAGYSTIFLKIYSPLCKPVYATVALFVAVGQWNSWFDAMLYNRMSSNLTTLQYELMKLLSSVTNQGTSAEAMKNAAGTVTPTSVRAAATIITMLPIICIYPFLQKQALLQNCPIEGQRFAFPVFDGFPIQMKQVNVFPVGNADEIILSSDGYPHLYSTLHESECYLADILEKDPLCMRLYKSTKGVKKGNCSFDDRAYLKIKLKK